MEQTKLVPKRRFKEFQNTSAWEQRRLGDVAEISAGGDIDKTKLSGFGKYPVIANALTNDGIIGYYENDFRIEAPAVTVTGRGDVGHAQARKTNFTPVVRLLSVKSKHDVDFLEHAINKHKVLVESTGVPQLTSPQLANYKIWFTSLEEEKKIGRFFCSLDNLITLHQRKLEKMKAIKSAYLSEMFPAEGERVPKRRFAGFTQPWEQRKFSEIATVRRGLTYKPSDITENGIRVLRSSNINEDTFELRSDDVFVKKDAVNIEPVKENDILITSANGSSRLVGKHALINGIKTNMVHGGFMLLASSMQPYFVNALMSSSWYNKFINVYVSGGNGAIGNLSKGDLESQIIYTPSEDEQIKIGNFFKRLDEIITLHQRKLEKLQNLKKAYLNEMFV